MMQTLYSEELCIWLAHPGRLNEGSHNFGEIKLGNSSVEAPFALEGTKKVTSLIERL